MRIHLTERSLELDGLNGISDERLFERYRRGDSDALRTLIERHDEDLLRFLTRLVGDRSAAEDVFQETFLQIHLSAESFDASRRFRPWLFTIAANKGRDYLRKRGRQQSMEVSAPVGGDGERPSIVDLMELDVPSPDTAMDERERDILVQRALSGLSPTMREILLLAYFQRLSYAQMAEDLQIPLGTVKSRLHAAVAAFAKRWHEVSRGSN
ncbi:MAG: sigma-70 family RNA polymerase sigma factor [Phycisphaerales bacterium]|nr:sigma-70 family RNA polymerase sigma factor [Phycisphaerales bacterium]